MKWTLGIITLSTIVAHADPPPRCPAPKVIDFEIDEPLVAIKRDPPKFTEGLELRNGMFFESVGGFDGGYSELNTVDMNGKTTTLAQPRIEYFGEGVTVLKDRVYQLVWHDRKVLTYDLKPGSNELKPGAANPELRNPRKGWGATNDGKSIITSDGSSELFFHDPTDFAKRGSVRVRDDLGPVSQLNELEYVKGRIFANVYDRDEIVRINPNSGCVEARADLKPFMAGMRAKGYAIPGGREFVPNGIAFDEKTGSFYLTGKHWPAIFKTKMVEGKSRKNPAPNSVRDSLKPETNI